MPVKLTPRLRRMVVLCCALLVAGCASVPSQECTCLTSSARKCETALDSSDPKAHVHVYFMHGLDPLDWANINSVVQFCRDMGYHHVKLVQHHEGDAVIEHIRCARANDAQSRFLIFGFSAGAASTRRVVRLLHERHGIDIDVVLYPGGIILLDNSYSRPEYVGKIIHILDGGRIIPGVKLTGAENHRFNDVWHFGTPTHPETLAILQRELARLSELTPSSQVP